MKSLNTYVKGLVQDNPNLAVPHYLCASYAYYKLDRPYLTDGAFDWLAKFMRSKWSIISHNHKHHITKDMLNAGTYLGEYPPIVENATYKLLVLQRQLAKRK